jgi:uncharacterized protein
MSVVYWDTMLFVYWLEDHPTLGPRTRQIRTRMQQRHDELCTSALTVGEILTGPYKQNSLQGLDRVQAFFTAPWVNVLPFTQSTAVHYARIRAALKVLPVDAIHLACAAEAKVDLFLTNDYRLVGKIVPGIQFIAGLNTDLF